MRRSGRKSNDSTRLCAGLAREQGFLPLWIKGGVLHVAISSPKALSNADDLRVLA